MTITLALIVHIDLMVGSPIEVGTVDGHNSRCIPITGGVVSGSYTGEVLAGGADWQQIGPDGTIDVDARYVLKLTEGLVEVTSQGLRAGSPDILDRLAKGESVDPSLYYFRTAMRFKTAAPALNRLNRILAVSTGERLANIVRLSVYEVS